MQVMEFDSKDGGWLN